MKVTNVFHRRYVRGGKISKTAIFVLTFVTQESVTIV